MNNSTFISCLSAGLDISEEKVSGIMRKLKRAIKISVREHNSFSLPYLGSFKVKTSGVQSAYSHYHGYKIQTGLKRRLVFTQDTDNSNPQDQNLNMAEELAEMAGITQERAFMFLCTMTAVINMEISSGGKIFVSGIGIFKSETAEDDYTITKFRADASLRRLIPILLTSGKVQSSYRPSPEDAEITSTETIKGEEMENQTVRKSFTTLNETISQVRETRKKIIPVTNLLNPRPINMQAKYPEEDAIAAGSGGGMSSGTISPSPSSINSEFTEENDSRNRMVSSRLPAYIQAGSDKKFTHRDRKDEEKKLPYLEWGIIAFFLMILLIGIYMIRPDMSAEKSFDNQPFSFAEKTEINSKSTTPAETVKTGSIEKIQISALKKYNIKSGDTLWAISEKIYKTPWLWPVLYSANKDKLNSPDQLDISQNLVIPDIQNTLKNLSPEERKIVKQAYKDVYQAYEKLGKASARDYLDVGTNL